MRHEATKYGPSLDTKIWTDDSKNKYSFMGSKHSVDYKLKAGTKIKDITNC